MLVSDFFFIYLSEKQTLRVDGFGIFEAQTQDAYIHPINSEINPPYLKVLFRLDKNITDDGFIEFAAEKMGMTKELLVRQLKTEKESWITALRKAQPVDFKLLGTLKLNAGGVVVFVQNQDISLSKGHFGLAPFTVEPIESLRQEPVVQIKKQEVKKSNKRWLLISSAAAVLVVGLGLTYWFFGDRIFNSKSPNQTTVAASEVVDSVVVEPSSDVVTIADSSYQTALNTDTIPEDSLLVDEQVVQEKPVEEVQPVEPKKVEVQDQTGDGRYLVVAGCFKEPDKADEYLKALQDKGFDASIDGKTSGGLIRVTLGRWPNWSEAQKVAKEFNSKQKSTSWIQKLKTNE